MQRGGPWEKLEVLVMGGKATLLAIELFKSSTTFLSPNRLEYKQHAWHSEENNHEAVILLLHPVLVQLVYQRSMSCVEKEAFPCCVSIVTVD